MHESNTIRNNIINGVPDTILMDFNKNGLKYFCKT
jgi:hypothetical protein